MRPKELENLLKIAIPAKKNVCIVGPPGTGKTDIVKQVCADLKVKLILSHPVVSDPTDYKGLPFEKDGKAEFLPFNDLKELLETKVPTVFFIDDMGQAEYSVQKALMQLLWGGKLNGHEISNQVSFVAATNRKQDKAGVQGILECVKSRFHTIVTLDPSMEDWIAWAKTHDMPMELIAFARFRDREKSSIFNFKPSVTIEDNSPCGRTVANVGHWMNLGIYPQNDEHFEIIKGAIGEGLAMELRKFIMSIHDLPDIDELMKNADDFMTPKGYTLPRNRPDLAITICGALVNRLTKSTYKSIMKIAEKLDDEFSFVLVNDAVEKLDMLKETVEFNKWVHNHSEYVSEFG